MILNSVVRTPVPAGMSVSAAYPAAVSPMALTAPAFRKKAAHEEVDRAEAQLYSQGLKRMSVGPI